MAMRTFVVRLWCSDEEPRLAGLRGVVEGAGSREPRPFKDDAELLSLLNAGLCSAEPTEPRPSERRTP
jgi:hypothetical protein